MTLTINIHEIRENKAKELTGTLDIEPKELGLASVNGVKWPKNLTFEYVLSNAGALFLLRGRLLADFIMECNRCLKPVDTHLDIEISEQYGREADIDQDIRGYVGDEIDVSDGLRDNIHLQMPNKSLCSPDCRGLCPKCGIDKNADTCECNTRTVDPRLAVLEKLLSK